VITDKRNQSNIIQNRSSQLYKWNNKSSELKITLIRRTINYAQRTINWVSDSRYNKAFKKRERNIKNTKVYTGSPFLKGYVQSFANQQRIPLTKISKINFTQYILPVAHKKSLFLQQTTAPYNSCLNYAEPTALNQLQLQILCNW